MACGIRATFRRVVKHFSKWHRATDSDPAHRATDSDPADARSTPTPQGPRDHVHTSMTSRPTAASNTPRLTSHHRQTKNSKVPRKASVLRISPARASGGVSRVNVDAPTAGFARAVLGESKPSYQTRMPITAQNNSISAGVHSETESPAQSTNTTASVFGVAENVRSHDDAFSTFSKPSYLQRMPQRNAATPHVQSTAHSPATRTTEHQGLPTPPNEIDDVRGLTRDGTSIMIITPPSTAGSSINGKATSAHPPAVSEDTNTAVQHTDDATKGNVTSSIPTADTGNLAEPITATAPGKGCHSFPSIATCSPPCTPPRKGSLHLAARPGTPRFSRKQTSNTRFVKSSVDPLLIDAYRTTMAEYTRQPGIRHQSKVPSTPNRSTRMAPTTPGFNPRMTPLSHIKHRDAATMSFRRFVGHNRKKARLNKDDFIRRRKCCEVDGGEDTPEAVPEAGESSEEDDEYTAFYESLTRWTKADKKKCLLAKFDLRTGSKSPTARLAARAVERYSLEMSENGGSHSEGEEGEDEDDSVWQQDWDTSAEMTEVDFQGAKDAADSGGEQDSAWEDDWDSDGDSAVDGQGLVV